MTRFESPRVGTLPSGTLDRISDIEGVRVGHATLARGAIQTGITVIEPHAGDHFMQRVPAAATVINGFGKSVGLIQLQELGVIESPIALTNTFSVGEIATAQIREAIARHPQIGRGWPTSNPLVLECNDGYLNDIQAFAVHRRHYEQARAAATVDFEQGSVGAGRGMSCCQLKGGIGSASRRVQESTGSNFAVGALALANFGRLPDLRVAGSPIGRQLASAHGEHAKGTDKGSIIIVLATNAPLDTRQLRRLSLRAAAGLARTGSVYGHGSGDIVIAFSTAYRIPFEASVPMPAVAMLHETRLDPFFQAAAEATEQAIIHALWAATPVRGRDGHMRSSIVELMPRWSDTLASSSHPQKDRSVKGKSIPRMT